MKESTIHKKILAYLRGRGYWAVKLPGSAFLRGMPDVLAIREGHATWIEVKQPGGRATKLQAAILEQLAAAGCTTLVADSVESVAQQLGIS